MGRAVIQPAIIILARPGATNDRVIGSLPLEQCRRRIKNQRPILINAKRPRRVRSKKPVGRPDGPIGNPPLCPPALPDHTSILHGLAGRQRPVSPLLQALMQRNGCTGLGGEGFVRTHEHCSGGVKRLQLNPRTLNLHDISLILAAVDQTMPDKNITAIGPGGNVRAIAQTRSPVVTKLSPHFYGRPKRAGIMDFDELGRIGCVLLIRQTIYAGYTAFGHN